MANSVQNWNCNSACVPTCNSACVPTCALCHQIPSIPCCHLQSPPQMRKDEWVCKCKHVYCLNCIIMYIRSNLVFSKNFGYCAQKCMYCQQHIAEILDITSHIQMPIMGIISSIINHPAPFEVNIVDDDGNFIEKIVYNCGF